MNINIKIIPHKKQRYPTVGDWFFDKESTLQIRVSELSNPNFEQLVAYHEVVEALLCDQQGVTQDDVDRFDMEYERNRIEGDVSEPGDSPAAPYYHQHQIATAHERMMAVTLGVDWNEYEKEINSL